MYNNAGNAVPERYSHLTIAAPFDGKMQTQTVPPSINTHQREIAEQKLKDCGSNLDACLYNCFADRINECRAYIVSKGETPKTDITLMAAQVALLRAQDIANQGAALDMSDESSLQEIERTEQGLQDINSPDMYSALSFPIQAAVKIMLDHLSDKHSAQGGSGKMSDVLYFLLNDQPANVSAPMNNADGPTQCEANTDAYMNSFNGYINDHNLSDTGYVAGDAGSGLSKVISRSFADGNTDDGGFTYISANPYAGQDTGEGDVNETVDYSHATNLTNPGTTGAANSSGIFGFLTTLMNNAGNLANAVKGAANSTAGAAGAVKNAVSNVGANSIATYVSNNKGTILLVVGIILVVIIAIIYAAKHRR